MNVDADFQSSQILDYLDQCLAKIKRSNSTTRSTSISSALKSFSSRKHLEKMTSCCQDNFFDYYHRDVETVNNSSPDAKGVKSSPSPHFRRLLIPKRSRTRQRPTSVDIDESRTFTTSKRPAEEDVASRCKYTKYSQQLSPASSRDDSQQHLVCTPPEPTSCLPNICDDQEVEDIGLVPTIKGKVDDVKSISADTMADIITGRLSVDADVTIVDCRYPYEYDGGHIRGAINLFTPAEVTERFFPTANFDSDRHHVIVFHCEFSSERGPKMYRNMRQHDRHINAQHYPRLSYPHIYLLDAGYSAFYQQYKALCDPEGYTSMFHADHKQDMRKFRVKSKSWPLVKSRRDGNNDVRKTLLF